MFSPVLEAERDTPPLNVLLPYASHHLRNVDKGALAARRHHLDDVVLRVRRQNTTQVVVSDT